MLSATIKKIGHVQSATVVCKEQLDFSLQLL